MPPLALPVKLTANGACPEVGDALALALREGVALTDMFTVALAVLAALSVTVKVAVKLPAAE